MHLHDRSRHHGRDRAFHRDLDGVRFVLATGQQQQLARLHDRADAHRDGVLGHLVNRLEEARVVLTRLLRQRFDARARTERRAWLVESDVAVRADAQHLQVNSACLLDALLVPAAVLLNVIRHAVRHVHPTGIDVDVLEQILPHEVVVALIVFRRQTHVLVQVERGDLGEIQTLFLVHPDQLFVQAQRGAARGQTEHTVRFPANQRRHDLRSLFAHLIVVVFDEH